jgi:hypothetical protein
MGRDSSVGIATRYWLDGPGIESRYGFIAYVVLFYELKKTEYSSKVANI